MKLNFLTKFAAKLNLQIMKRKLTVLIIAIMITGASFAQEKITAKPGVSIMSRYIWRGLNLGGSSLSVQPSLELTAGHFTFGTWGAFSTNSSLTVQETDLYLTYNINDAFSLTVTDYFLPEEAAFTDNYFELEQDSTGHVVELAGSFNGTDKIPFTFLAAVNVWGADARKIDNSKQYSTYFELGYKATLNNVDYRIFIGGTATSPDTDKGETGYYADDAGITNFGVTAVKKIELTDKFTLPLTTSFIINPKSEKVFLVVGIAL